MILEVEAQKEKTPLKHLTEGTPVLAGSLKFKKREFFKFVLDPEKSPENEKNITSLDFKGNLE